jgi:hypothetical protein
VTRQVSHNAPRNVKRRLQRAGRLLPAVEREVEELQTAVDAQSEMLAETRVTPKQEPAK